MQFDKQPIGAIAYLEMRVKERKCKIEREEE
jgi:hypothetical protein